MCVFPLVFDAYRNSEVLLEGGGDLPTRTNSDVLLEGGGDLPTPPYGHPSVREASACAEEGIY